MSSSRRARRRGRGRPPTGKDRLQLKIEPKILTALRLHAKQTKRSLSAITETALARYLNLRGVTLGKTSKGG